MATTLTTAFTAIRGSDGKLPSSLTGVISDLQSDGCDDIVSACFVTSRSVTRKKRAQLVESILDGGVARKSEQEEDEEEGSAAVTTSKKKVVGSAASGIALVVDGDD